MNDEPTDDWNPNFAANPLGCATRPLREHLAPDAQYRSQAYKTRLCAVRDFARDTLDIALSPTKHVEPVFAEVLIEVALAPAVPA